MQVQSYIARVIENIKTRFPHVHLLASLGYFDQRNVEKATPTAMLEVEMLLMGTRYGRNSPDTNL